MLLDECHIGGSLKGKTEEDASSLKSIFTFFAPTKRLYVSATTATANTAVLGTRADHTFHYKLSEAFEDGMLHPVNLIEVHTGTRAKIVAIEKAFNASLEDLQERTSDDLPEL